MYQKQGNIRCHIELSNHCNAACPMCGRNNISNKEPYTMTIREDVNTNELTITDIKKIFDKKFFDTYNFIAINMIGNRGDPATSTHLFEICEYLFDNAPDLKIAIATNGGLKTPSYWGRLGKLFVKYGNGSKVTFGIDGLEDTNHIYRQNVNFKKVIQNAKAFIDNGGIAWWQYLIFKHNEHQIGEAQELATKIGFKEFFSIHTPRFAHTQKRDGYKVFTYKGKTHVLQTADPEFAIRNESFDFILSEEAEEIECKAKKNKEFYIDNGGRLIPCCWLGNSLDKMLGKPESQNDLIMNWYDVDEMNVIQNDLVDTLQHSFISSIIPMAWDNIKGESCAARTCKAYCSKNRNIRKRAFKSEWT